ncbi:hypothetical protein GIS00_17775 [Nakamurella sp. YIM 132087]|uniref:HTH luxR-type domain-containing protein n=1 Tax=Nakamurella alba TaxID=2665158 RepID=A0A7K1FNP0_9ACTN|nr:LuxR C-terminal-related transcriptional regulator [Nakamurella alba]MTD15787.1 hypothetical protein [Nakamurella alba]
MAHPHRHPLPQPVPAAVHEIAGPSGPVRLPPLAGRLLAVLLDRPGAELSTGEIAMVLWRDTDRPAEPAAAVHTAMGRLRAALPAGAVARGRRGYVLAEPPEVVRRLPAPGARPVPGARPALRPVPSGPAGGPTTSASRAGPGSGPERPSVGRAAEREDFVGLLTTGGPGLLLRGPAGIGKTHLAEDLLATAESLGWPTVLLRCRSAIADVPLAAFAPLLGGDGVAPGADGGPLALLLAVRGAIGRWRGAGRLLIGLDDVDMLDATSLLLLDQLIAERALLPIATSRSGATLPETVARWCDEGSLVVREVAPLSAGQAAELGATVTGDALSPDESARLHRLAGGNPLHALAVIRAGAHRSGAAPGVGLREFVARRLQGLSGVEENALRLIALGEPLSPAMAEELVGEEVLTVLERDGLIAVADHRLPGKDVRSTDLGVAHPLYGEVLRAGTSPLAARAAYRRLLSAAERVPEAGRPGPLRRAGWASESGLGCPPEVLAAAVAEAARAGDADAVEQLSRLAWVDHQVIGAGVRWLSTALDRHPVDADRRSARIAVLAAARRGGAEDRMAAELLRFRELLWCVGDVPAAGQLVRDWSARAGAEGGMGRAASALALALQGRAERALDLSLPLVDAERPAVRAAASLAAVRSHTHLGAFDAALQLIDGYERAGRSDGVEDDHWSGALLGEAAAGLDIAAAQVLPLIQAGRCREAETVAAEVHERARTTGNRVARGTAALMWGEALAFRGLLVPGLARQLEAVSLFRVAGHRVRERWACEFAVLLAATIREDATVDALLQRISELVELPGIWGHRVDFARAEQSASRRDMSGAVTHQRLAVIGARRNGAVFEESYMADAIVYFGDPGEVVGRMSELGDRLGGLAAVLAGAARGMHRRDPAVLQEFSMQLHDCGVEDYAVRAAACTAEAWAAAGDQRSATGWAGRAAEWMAVCELGNATVPAPLLLVEPLTSREREIADLAAGGAGSRAIAERLMLSPRTVDNHLARAYDKLGIRSRTQLAGVIGAPGGYSTGR